jgi:hypothetical protein
VLTRYVCPLGALLPFPDSLVAGFLRAHQARQEIAQAVSASNTEFIAGFNYRFRLNHMMRKRFNDAGACVGPQKSARSEKSLATINLIEELLPRKSFRDRSL